MPVLVADLPDEQDDDDSFDLACHLAGNLAAHMQERGFELADISAAFEYVATATDIERCAMLVPRWEH